MSKLSDLGSEAKEALENIEGWVATAKEKAAAIADEGLKYAGNPLIDAIVEAELHIPAEWITAAVTVLKSISVMHETPVTEAAAQPADPAAAAPAEVAS